MEDTLSYYNYANGWTSRWSYVPEWMTHMNSNFYTFKNGNLYIHNLNQNRNNFYGVPGISTLSTIFNVEPTTVKKFKNIFIDSNDPWKATMYTNLDQGFADYDYYDKKEGRWYAYIRIPQGDNNAQLLSTQGIGDIVNYTSPTMYFNVDIQVNLNQGDKVYKIVGSSLVELGTVSAFTQNAISLSSIVSTPSVGDTIVIVKNAVAESFGPRGYYLQVDFENNKNYEVTMFAVGASVFKSFP
jgi:hypothetical protein